MASSVACVPPFHRILWKSAEHFCINLPTNKLMPFLGRASVRHPKADAAVRNFNSGLVDSFMQAHTTDD